MERQQTTAITNPTAGRTALTDKDRGALLTLSSAAEARPSAGLTIALQLNPAAHDRTYSGRPVVSRGILTAGAPR